MTFGRLIINVLFICLALSSQATPAPSSGPRFKITDLGAPPGYQYVSPCAINASGQIAATAYAQKPSHHHAVLYTGGHFQDLGTLGGTDSEAYGLNNKGAVVGWAGMEEGGMGAFLWEKGKMTSLGGFRPGGINDSGQIVGSSYGSKLDNYIHAYLWEQGKLKFLGTLSGDFSNAEAINNAGQVAGYSIQVKGPHIVSSADHAFLWKQEEPMRDIGTLGDDSLYSQAHALNDQGEVVGWSMTTDAAIHAFLYRHGQMRDLGTLGGTQSFALGINNKSQVVGHSLLEGRSGFHAFLYAGNRLYDLQSCIPADSGWVLTQATAINERGQIVGVGEKQGMPHGFLLTPVGVIP